MPPRSAWGTVSGQDSTTLSDGDRIGNGDRDPHDSADGGDTDRYCWHDSAATVHAGGNRNHQHSLGDSADRGAQDVPALHLKRPYPPGSDRQRSESGDE